MRVAVDFKVMSTEAALRGMGRYTQQQVRAVLDADCDIEIVLLLHDKIDRRNCLIDWLSHPRVTPVRLHADDAGWALDRAPNFNEVLSYSRRLDAALRHFKVDLYHSATPFIVPFDTGVTACPVVSTFYDCIPLVFPSYYLPNESVRNDYIQCLHAVSRSERVIAISEASRDDLHRYSGYDQSRVDIAYPVVEDIFRSSDASENDRLELVASSGWVPPSRFILSVTGFHRSKNVKTLLVAFAAARRAGIALPLVLVMPGESACRMFHLENGHPEGVEVLVDIPEENLARLYRLADFVVQISLYEGFGYPVAEAMASGAAVIAAAATSIPEIAGPAAILVPPLDSSELTRHMLHLASDCVSREALRVAALRRAAQFTNSAELGAATVSSYRKALTTASDRQPKVAIWSSMPPLDCGVADYSAELAGALADSHQVHVYTDGSYKPKVSSSAQVLWRDTATYSSEEAPDATIFQLGGRDYQSFMFEPLREHGGTVVLHDLSMGLGFYYIARARSQLESFEDKFLAPEGIAACAEYARIDATTGDSEVPRLEAFFERHRLLRWAIGGGNPILVHTEELRDEVERAYPGTDVRVVRMGVTDSLPQLRHLPRQAWRTALGVGPRGLVVGSFGIIDRVKRLGTAVRAFANLLRNRPDSVMFIVGRAYDVTYAAELRAEIEASPARDRIIRLDYVPQAGFQALMSLCDVVVNLRWPTRLGVSAVLIRALAAGKPVIATDVAEWRSIGNEALLRLAPDENEEINLTQFLETLAGTPHLRASLSAAARKWFLANGTVHVMAGDYLGASAASARTPVGSVA